MKPELNSELKQRFFAQYIGAEIDMPFDGRGLRPDGKITSWNLPMMAKGGSPILLRPISSITDPEAIEFIRQELIIEGHPETIKAHTLKVHRNPNGLNAVLIRSNVESSEGSGIFGKDLFLSASSDNLRIYHVDLLRSKSFAIPYMGHSVAELVKAGWIKLVEG